MMILKLTISALSHLNWLNWVPLIKNKSPMKKPKKDTTEIINVNTSNEGWEA